MDNRERLALLDRLNLCHKCEKAPQMRNRKHCAECLEKITIRNRERYDQKKAHEYQARRRELYRQKKADGICVRCSKPATHGIYCLDHSIQEKRNSAARAQRSKYERHARGLIPEYREKNHLCCYCGNPIENEKQHGRACDACAAQMSVYARKGDKTYWSALQRAFWEEKKTKK